MKRNVLEFVKDKLEEGEGVSSGTLSAIVTAAQFPARRYAHWHIPALIAASLTVAACGWFFSIDSRRDSAEGNLVNTINLLRLADGDSVYDGDSLLDNLTAWQDAPALAVDVEIGSVKGVN